MTLKTGVMADKLQRCVTEINYILKYIKKGKPILKIAILFHNITVFNQINTALMSMRDS